MGSKKNQPYQISQHAKQAVRIAKTALEDKKGEAITITPLPLSSNFADAMVIASGTSSTHVETLAREVTQSLKEEGFEILGIEGVPTNQWVLVDAGDILVHIFLPEIREMYSLEKMWSHHFDGDDDNTNSWLDDRDAG